MRLRSRLWLVVSLRTQARRGSELLLRSSCRGVTARIPQIMRPCDIGCGRPLGVTILAIVETILGAGWNTKRRAEAIALYIGAAAKWARIKFDVTHVPGSAMRAGAAAGQISKAVCQRRLHLRTICPPKSNARRAETQRVLLPAQVGIMKPSSFDAYSAQWVRHDIPPKVLSAHSMELHPIGVSSEPAAR